MPAPVTDVFGVRRAYAATGVFAEFEERARADGCFEARFRWLLPQIIRVVIDVPRRRLSCPRLFDSIPPRSGLRREVLHFLGGRQTAELPPHRRIDTARCRVSCKMRSGQLTLALEVRDDWAYAGQQLINLVHETFIFLNRYWPEYAHESMGATLE